MIPSRYRSRSYLKLPDTKAHPPAARELTQAEEELLLLLKQRGVKSICDSISKEINYVWAVLSGFKTLANVANFYFACGSQTFGYNPAFDFFESNGLQLAVFTLQKFVHNEQILLPVLECIHVFTKLHVEGALEFCAVDNAQEILMKCVRYHDNKSDVISAACQALGSLVLNGEAEAEAKALGLVAIDMVCEWNRTDQVKEHIGSPELVIELLALLKRFEHTQDIVRATMIPLGFLVTDPRLAMTFIDSNGIAFVMTPMTRFKQDAEIVWHALGILDALDTKIFDLHIICAIDHNTGIQQLVEALAGHLDTEEIAVEGFRLLSKIASLPDTFRAINKCRVLDLACVAIYAYAGTQHRHTRLDIKRSMFAFQKCTLYDSNELARRERASRKDVAIYFLFVILFTVYCAFATNDVTSGRMTRSLTRPLELPALGTLVSSPSTSLNDVSSVQDVWDFLQGPFKDLVFASEWYNGDKFSLDVESPTGMVDRSNVLLGGVQLRLLRAKPSDCSVNETLSSVCVGEFLLENELKVSPMDPTRLADPWVEHDSSHPPLNGRLAVYPVTGGFMQHLDSLRVASTTTNSSCTDAVCRLSLLQRENWIDWTARAMFVELNVYNPAEVLHCFVRLVFEFAATGGVLASNHSIVVNFRQYPRLFAATAHFYLEVAVLGAACWFTTLQIGKLCRYRWYYFLVWSHVLDFTLVALWMAVIVIRLKFLIVGTHALFVQLATSSFTSVLESIDLMLAERYLMASCASLMWIRLFRLANCFRPFDFLVTRLHRSAGRVLSFALVFGIFILTFAQIGVLLFADVLGSFRGLDTAILAMVRALWRSNHFAILGSERLASSTLAFQLLFHWGSRAIVVNMIVVILRERFDSSHRRTKGTRRVEDVGVSLVQLAKTQLTGLGLLPSETPIERLTAKTKQGLAKVQDAAKRLFTIEDEMAELMRFKHVWGFDNHNGKQRTVEDVLKQAQREETQLNASIEKLSVRINKLMKRLETISNAEAASPTTSP